MERADTGSFAGAQDRPETCPWCGAARERTLAACPGCGSIWAAGDEQAGPSKPDGPIDRVIMSPGCIWAFGIVVALLVALVLLPYIVMALLFSDIHLVDPPRPAVVQSLVDAAPAGSRVAVRHHDRDRWGSYSAHWQVVVSGVPTDTTMAAYSIWCEAQGLPPRPAQGRDVGLDCGDVALYLDADDNGDPVISGVIYDDSSLVR